MILAEEFRKHKFHSIWYHNSYIWTSYTLQLGGAIYLCLWWKHRKPGPRKECCKKGWWLYFSTLLPTTASKMYFLYTLYEFSVFARLQALLQPCGPCLVPWARSLQCSLAAGKPGAGVPITCSAALQGCGLHSLRWCFPLQSTLILQSWQQWSLFSWYQQERR